MKINIIFLIVLLLCVFGLAFQIVPKYTIVNLEGFQSDTQTEEQNLYVDVSTDDYDIKPFNYTSEEVKKDVADCFQREWGDTGVTYTPEFIIETWKYPDALYIVTDKDGNFIGSAGIDRKYFFPFISHIYVKKEHRKHGYGEKLFEVVLQHGKKVGYKTVNGWCQDELVDYYENLGCKREKSTILLKPLVGFNLMSREV
jgi:GNAT superfamily N-acetyltransferase